MSPEGEAWVLVTLTPAEWERLAKDKPARLTALATRTSAELVARPSGIAPVEDVKRSMINAYYVLPGKQADLAIHKRMRVELPISGEAGKQKVVPYSAVYYDAKGEAWVYVGHSAFDVRAPANRGGSRRRRAGAAP